MTKTWSLAGILLLAVLASGCTSSIGWSVSVGWTEPGLFASIPPTGARGALHIETGVPESVLPFRHARVDRVWGPGGYWLEQVSWWPSAVRAHLDSGFELVAEGADDGAPFLVRLWAADSLGLPQVRQYFTEFLQNISQMSPEQQKTLEDGFAASRSYWGYSDPGQEPSNRTEEAGRFVQIYEYSIRFNATLRLGGLFEALIASGQFPGNSTLYTSSEWQFPFTLAVHEARGTFDGDRVTLRVRADDWTEFDRLGAKDLPDEAVWGLLNTTFAQLDFGSPRNLQNPRFEHSYIHGEW